MPNELRSDGLVYRVDRLEKQLEWIAWVIKHGPPSIDPPATTQVDAEALLAAGVGAGAAAPGTFGAVGAAAGLAVPAGPGVVAGPGALAASPGVLTGSAVAATPVDTADVEEADVDEGETSGYGPTQDAASASDPAWQAVERSDHSRQQAAFAQASAPGQVHSSAESASSVDGAVSAADASSAGAGAGAAAGTGAGADARESGGAQAEAGQASGANEAGEEAKSIETVGPQAQWPSPRWWKARSEQQDADAAGGAGQQAHQAQSRAEAIEHTEADAHGKAEASTEVAERRAQAAGRASATSQAEAKRQAATGGERQAGVGEDRDQVDERQGRADESQASTEGQTSADSEQSPDRPDPSERPSQAEHSEQADQAGQAERERSGQAERDQAGPSDKQEQQPQQPQAQQAQTQQPRPQPQPRPKSEARLAVERFIADARKEGNVGRYLLSAASALLVIMAAVSFIALVWDLIPAGVKVGALGGLGALVVASGATLSMHRPNLRVAASTMMGTGGSMGFVAIIGAVILEDGVIPVWLAFGLMTVWGMLLLVLSRMTAQFFTAIVSSIGALVTVVFASRYGADVFDPTVLWSFIFAYVVVLGATSALLPGRKMRPMVTAPWYPTTSMIVTAYALLATPVDRIGEQSSVMADAILIFLCAVLLVQVFHSSQLLFNSRFRVVAGFDWGVVGTVVLIAGAMRVLPDVDAASDVADGGFAFSVFFLMLFAVGAAAFVYHGSAGGWRRRCAPVFLVVALTAAMMASTADGRCLAFSVVVAGLATLPLLQERVAWVIVIVPGAGLLTLVRVVFGEGAFTGEVNVGFTQFISRGLLVSALFGVLFAVALTVVGERMLDAAVRPAEAAKRAAVLGWASGQQTVDAGAAGLVPGQLTATGPQVAVGQQAPTGPQASLGQQMATGTQVSEAGASAVGAQETSGPRVATGQQGSTGAQVVPGQQATSAGPHLAGPQDGEMGVQYKGVGALFDPQTSASAIRRILVWASWLVSATLIVDVPVYVHGLFDPGDMRTTASTFLFAVALGLLLVRGLVNGEVTPAKLLIGSAGMGSSATGPAAIAPAARGTSAGRSLAMSTSPGEAWAAWILAGAGAIVTMLRAEFLVSVMWQPLFVVLALSLCAVASRALWPWLDDGRVDRRAIVIAVAGLNTAIVWWSFVVLTGQSLGSLLMTAVILATGALCIVLGFRLRVKLLRHYGLVLIVASVLKLAAYDITTSNSITRILVLGCGGVVCFVLSLAYNRIASDEAAAAGQGAGSSSQADGSGSDGSWPGGLQPGNSQPGDGRHPGDRVPGRDAWAGPDRWSTDGR